MFYEWAIPSPPLPTRAHTPVSDMRRPPSCINSEFCGQQAGPRRDHAWHSANCEQSSEWIAATSPRGSKGHDDENDRKETENEEE